MPPRLGDPASRAAFQDAIRRIEAASSVEVFVAIRRRSASYAHAHVLTGAAVGVAAHAFMLYSAHPFALSAMLLDPVIAGVAGGLLSTLSLGIERLFTSSAARRRVVRAAAQATFVDHGVHRTRARTGLLVYVSQVERVVELVADDGMVSAVAEEGWAKLVAGIQAALPQGGVAIARALGELAPVLGRVLPRAHDDVNELPDAVDVGEGTT